MAIEASAAAIAMINMVKKNPCSWCGNRYLLKITKLIFTAFSISSIDIRMVIILRRKINPYTPVKNMNELIINRYLMEIVNVILFVFFL